MMGQLIPVGGGDPIPLRKPKLLVGRRPSCDIRLEFPNVSSQHCELEWINGYWRLRDLRSSNGTKVRIEVSPVSLCQCGSGGLMGLLPSLHCAV